MQKKKFLFGCCCLPQGGTWWVWLIFSCSVSTLGYATLSWNLINMKGKILWIFFHWNYLPSNGTLWLILQLICFQWIRQWEISALKNIISRWIKCSEILEMPRIKCYFWAITKISFLPTTFFPVGHFAENTCCPLPSTLITSKSYISVKYILI